MDWRSFLVGLIVGWLVELIIDFVFWRRAQDDVISVAEHQEQLAAAEARIQQLETKLSQKEATLQTNMADQAACAQKLEAAVQEIESLKTQLAARTDTSAAFSSTAVDAPEIESTRTAAMSLEDVVPDDLKKIEGIGPKIESIFHDAGILTFAQLAVADVAHLQKLLAAAGPRYRLADPGTWPQQAALANAGQWQELSRLQENLKGGRQHSAGADDEPGL
jgi:predicted flap endonuclease-1-like 5' DNA nuclease